MFGRIGPLELLIILAIIVIIFGAGKLAGLGGALGRGIKEFRHEVKEESKAGETAGAPSASEVRSVQEPEVPVKTAAGRVGGGKRPNH